jgi:lysophospholipase L1-like esterase
MKSRKAFSLAATALLLLVGLEAGLRVTLGLGDPPLLQPDPQIGYLYQENQDLHRFGNRVHINSVHQRSDDLTARADSTILRVLFLGDSVTWGGVLVDQDNTYPEVFEEHANANCERKVEALNASAGSWGIGNLKAYLERFGTFGSDLVVLQIGSHDLLQETSDSSPVGAHPSFPTQKPTFATQELVSRYLWPRYIRPLLESTNAFAGPSPMTQRNIRQQNQFNKNMMVLTQTIRSLRQEDAVPIVVHTPGKPEVFSTENTTSLDTTYHPYRTRFLERLDSLQTPVLNFYERWKNQSKVQGYYRDRVHMNERGYSVIGRRVWKKLSSERTFAAECW